LAFIHKETFEILQGSNIDNYLDDYFEVDDAIALPIQTLNRKGYKTIACCAGHPFADYNETFSETKFTLEDCPIVDVVAIEENKTAYHPDCTYRLLLHQGEVNRGIYITFDKGTVFPNTLEMFYIDDEDDFINVTFFDENGKVLESPQDETVTLRAFYDKNIPVYDFLLENVGDLRDLHEWALALPENRKEVCE
jgi:hypothetical protein